MFRGSLDAAKSIVLEIHADSRYYLNHHQVDKRALINHLARMHAEDPALPLVLAPDANSSTDALVHAMDVGASLGIAVSISSPTT